MPENKDAPLDACLVAVPESCGSSLYGMVDVLAATGNAWQALVGAGEGHTLIRPRIIGPTSAPFRCCNGIPVEPAQGIADDPQADIIVIPDIWLLPDDSIKQRYAGLGEWLRNSYRRGAMIYAACTGSILLADSGLLDGCNATSHWAYEELFRRQYPSVQFQPAPNLCFADRAGRIVTAGGITSWHDLAIHIVSRHCNPGHALEIAKVYLLKWHSEDQLPYTNLVRRHHHADSAVRACEEALSRHFREDHAIARGIAASRIPERSLKRRFKVATGATLIEQVQRLRIEEAKRQLELGDKPVDEISAEVGYDEPAFFRRLFRRHTGLTPSEYRRLFKPIAQSAEIASPLRELSP